MITMEMLRKDLQRLELVPDDTVLIHSSLKSVGPVEGGADAVLDLLMDYFGSGGGLLVFPTLSYRTVNAEHPRFEVRNTPTSVGILAEKFRRRPGCVRSLHPTHSLAAFGRDAAAFVAGHEQFDTPCAKGSPWWRLLERNAKILFIGTGIECNTFCHGIDEWLGIPGLIHAEPQALEVVDDEGRIILVPSRRHAVGRNELYRSYEERFERAGGLKRGKFGEADTHRLDCRIIARELGVPFGTAPDGTDG